MCVVPASAAGFADYMEKREDDLKDWVAEKFSQQQQHLHNQQAAITVLARPRDVALAADVLKLTLQPVLPDTQSPATGNIWSVAFSNPKNKSFTGQINNLCKKAPLGQQTVVHSLNAVRLRRNGKRSLAAQIKTCLHCSYTDCCCCCDDVRCAFAELVHTKGWDDVESQIKEFMDSKFLTTILEDKEPVASWIITHWREFQQIAANI